MADARAPLTASTVLYEAQRVFAASGYVIKREGLDGLGLPAELCLLAEDPYSIVLVVAYAVWSDAVANWRSLQDAFVDAVSTRMTRNDPKAWDTYLVLLVPGELDPSQQSEAGTIRQDTSRARKLIAAGDDLNTLADVERAISSLLPLSSEAQLRDVTDPLTSLARQLQRRGIDQSAVSAVIEAFRQNKPLLDELHAHLSES